MAIKSYAEMRKIDVLPFCDLREALDDQKRKIKVPYLNWAKCKELLHQNGAEMVYFEPCTNANGSSLFMSDQVFTDSKGNTNRCYEVRVKIVIDDLEFEAQYPLMNGSNPVKDNSLTQQRVWNAQTRAFVKGVAMRTGLGFGLWLDDMDDKDASGEEDLSKHSLRACQERIQILYTNLLKKGMSTKDVADQLRTNESTINYMLTKSFEDLMHLEKDLQNLSGGQNG